MQTAGKCFPSYHFNVFLSILCKQSRRFAGGEKSSPCNTVRHLLFCCKLKIFNSEALDITTCLSKVPWFHRKLGTLSSVQFLWIGILEQFKVKFYLKNLCSTKASPELKNFNLSFMLDFCFSLNERPCSWYNKAYMYIHINKFYTMPEAILYAEQKKSNNLNAETEFL